VRKYLSILCLILVAVAGVVAFAFVRSPTLGLDLQGGLEVVLEAQAPKGQEVTDEGLDRAIETIRSRVDKLGVSEPEIRQQGSNQIAIALAGVTDPGRAAEIVGKTAQLEFYDLEGDLTGPSIDPNGFPVASERLLPILSSQQARAEEGEPGGWYLYGPQKNLLGGPGETQQEVLRGLGLTEAPEGSTWYAVPGDRKILTCGPPTQICPGVGEFPVTQTYYYLVKYQPDDAERPIPEITGEDLNADGTRQDFNPQTNQPIVTLEFTDRGGEKFHDITRELARRGEFKMNQLGIPAEEALQRFAIVLDDEIRSFPTIDFRDNPDGISGGRAQIEGLDSTTEAKDLALVLQTGALPYTFVQVDRSDVSATLGADSLREAWIAALVGLALVAVFLLVFYRFLGVVAILGLALTGVFLYGAILIFNVTLTLPGFAGLILTIGVAADANVVIFERIKEEVKAGKSVRAAIAAGYRKGFNTIVDANVVTALTAFVLFAVATGGVRGFALMLLIGTIISMLTAVLATRAFLGVLAGFRWFDNPAFMGATAQRIPRWQRIDFVGKWRLWFAISGIVLAIGIVSLGVRGLNLGIDFEGGSQVDFQTAQPTQLETVRSAVGGIVGEDAVIQGRGESAGGGYEAFQIKTESLDGETQTELQRALETQFEADSIGVRNVSASFSEQILRGAILAIVVSLLLIVIYVSFRFEWKFSIPVLVALFHDLLLALGVYSLSGREMTASTVAALLTILGYSIYDTIIIFDRVRENIPLMRKSSMAAIANQSLWETIRRSLATSFITLLPVAALLVLGGDTLKDFAFALLVGIASGAYSTIFIATPLLSLLKEREPEYAKRKAAGLQEKLELTAEEAEEEAALVEELEEAGVEAEIVEPEREADGEPVLAPAAEEAPAPSAAARREARRKRRRARPHGRAR
jgi:SecD/SecF fusion protein